jgi:integrase/recombinase XerD
MGTMVLKTKYMLKKAPKKSTVFFKSLIYGRSFLLKFRSTFFVKENTLISAFYLIRTLKMAQAKTFTQAELDQALRYVSTKKYAQRDRALILTSFWSGMRVGEISSLTMGNLINEDGTIKKEIRLSAAQTKGGNPRTVFIPVKLQAELQAYLATRYATSAHLPFFHSANRLGFSANSLCQWFFWIYRAAGISGASSHSGRRTFLTSLANKGIGVRILASLAGHRSIAVTMKY